MSDNPIRQKLAELKGLARTARIDLSREIEELEKKLEASLMPENEAWRRVELARHPERPTTLDYAHAMFDDFLELHGDRTFADDPAMVGGIALLGGRPVTFFGHQKGKNMKDNLKRNFGMAHPEGYRKALRLAHQAEKFGRPILSFIDTPGAFPGVSAEERGISQAIAATMKGFAELTVPVVVTVLGEGGSGGAIGIGVGDVVLIMENAFYSVISPEGCASILLRDPSKARHSASLLKLTPEYLLEFKVVDRIVREPPGGAHRDPAGAASALKTAIMTALEDLDKKNGDTLLAERHAKYLSLGVFAEQEPQRRSLLQRLRDFF
ncbi:MAG: acetyl-CoA carboxylase carboxyltransferase subunit alpha [Spirochaetes bacterium]|nr:acetyl-CoA carboxylase carboxyltransferase subunit alpha [Spirochaetota bacterium]